MPSETHETGIVSSASALASERARGRRMEIPAERLHLLHTVRGFGRNLCSEAPVSVRVSVHVCRGTGTVVGLSIGTAAMSTRRSAATAAAPRRSKAKAAALTLASLPDDALHHVIAAFSDISSVPLFDAVKVLGCVSKGIRQQLYGMQPLVGVYSLKVVRRPAHGPWRVTLLYEGALTNAVLEQARQGRVRSIDTSDNDRKVFGPASSVGQHRAVARRVVPDLLGAGCSLIHLDLSTAYLNDTWASIFGEENVCSAVLRWLYMECCGLRGPLPELRLPALLALDLSNNQLRGRRPRFDALACARFDALSENLLTGGLEPLRSCTALQWLKLGGNQLTGTLEPLRGCTALRELDVSGHMVDGKPTGGLMGGLEPLRGCTRLTELSLSHNQLTGSLEPLRGCTALERLCIGSNQLTGSLEPLRNCTALECLAAGHGNQLTGGLEPLRACKALQVIDLAGNKLSGGLSDLRSCPMLQDLYLEHNQLTISCDDRDHFEEKCGGIQIQGQTMNGQIVKQTRPWRSPYRQ